MKDILPNSVENHGTLRSFAVCVVSYDVVDVSTYACTL